MGASGAFGIDRWIEWFVKETASVGPRLFTPSAESQPAHSLTCIIRSARSGRCIVTPLLAVALDIKQVMLANPVHEWLTQGSWLLPSPVSPLLPGRLRCAFQLPFAVFLSPRCSRQHLVRHHRGSWLASASQLASPCPRCTGGSVAVPSCEKKTTDRQMTWRPLPSKTPRHPIRVRVAALVLLLLINTL